MAKAKITLGFLTITVILLLCCRPVFAANPQDKSLVKEISSGKNVIVLFHSQADEQKMANSTEDGDADFYDDWSFYLNSFIKKQGANIVIFRMTLREARQFFHSVAIPKDEWSVAFVKKGRPALYSQNPIMESDIYQFASRYFDGNDDASDAKKFGFSYITFH